MDKNGDNMPTKSEVANAIRSVEDVTGGAVISLVTIDDERKNLRALTLWLLVGDELYVRRRWQWRPGHLDAVLLDECATLTGAELAAFLLRLEGIQATVLDVPPK